MEKHLYRALELIRDKGCALLTILLVTLPLWVITLAFRGPRVALGVLVLLVIAVFALGWLDRHLDRHT